MINLSQIYFLPSLLVSITLDFTRSLLFELPTFTIGVETISSTAPWLSPVLL